MKAASGQARPGGRPLAPRVQLPAALLQKQEPLARPQLEPARPAPPVEPQKPIPALPPAPEPDLVASEAKPEIRKSEPVRLATADQAAILAQFNLESEDPYAREPSKSPTRAQHESENVAPNSRQKGRLRLGDAAESFSQAGRVARQPLQGARRRGSSREALGLVADFAEPEEGGTWQDAVGEGKPEPELTVHREKPVDIMSKTSTCNDVVIEWVEAPSTTQVLYPYGLDGPIVNYLEGDRPFAERHGDGLMSAKSVKLWIDRQQDLEYEEKMKEEQKWHGPTRFQRQVFTWRNRDHALLVQSYPIAENVYFAETVLNYTKVEHYAKCRETSHNLIVIPEMSQCWLIAHLAEKHLPNPGPVFGKKKKGRGWHCAIGSFEPVRKMYILGEPPVDEEQQEQTVSLALSVTKVHDGNMVQWEDAMGSIKHVCAYETPEGGWIYCGISGEETDQSLVVDKEEGCKLQFLTSRPPFV